MLFPKEIILFSGKCRNSRFSLNAELPQTEIDNDDDEEEEEDEKEEEEKDEDEEEEDDGEKWRPDWLAR